MKKTAIWNWIFAALLALGSATLATADDHGSDGSGHDSSTTSSSGSGQTQTGEDHGGQVTQTGDDHGNQPQTGDDKGGQTVQPGDDHGNQNASSDDPGGDQDLGIRRKLMPTPAGATLDASGHFEIRVQGSRQRFHLEAEVLIPNGTIFMVFADSNLAGTVTIQMGEGELRLDSEDGDLPEGMDPVRSIKTVTVTDANGNVILQGQV